MGNEIVRLGQCVNVAYDVLESAVGEVDRHADVADLAGYCFSGIRISRASALPEVRAALAPYANIDEVRALIDLIDAKEALARGFASFSGATPH